MGPGVLAAALMMTAPSPAFAQTEIVAPPAPDADALAAEMRVLAASPNDVSALISAGELTLKLGDPTAAARFFARAERIDPRNGRLKAGTASTLVHLERPGEALRGFAAAEALGYDPANFAADRGLAFDLLGEQERAQRDYRLALKRRPDDETLRRYALSLGISGRQQQAFEQIDGLLRRSDRAAWRDRAFILAMNGDIPGADRIATSMLPAGMASALAPFFQRLPQLSAVDRAFAVHFGELGATPQRIADARMMPPLPALVPEPAPVVQVAALPAKPADKRDRRDRRRRDRNEQVAVAMPQPVPALPPPPREEAPALVTVQPLPQPAAAQPPVRIASVEPRRDPGPLPRTPSTTQVAASLPASRSDVDRPIISATEQPRADLPIAPVVTAQEASPDREVPAERTDERSADTLVEPARAAPAQMVQSLPPEAGSATVPATVPATHTLRPTRVANEDDILAKIIAGIGVPAAELGVPPVRPGAPKPVETASVDQPAAAVPGTASPAKAVITAEQKKAADKALADKKIADKKAAEKKAADKAAADKLAAEKAAAKADPSRVWVQVAGGASVRDLPRDWAKLVAKAPVLKGKSAWTTPLRFTNRLLTGPFKTESEAQAFVNSVAKSGITGFVFTSEAGQKIAKLPAR